MQGYLDTLEGLDHLKPELPTEKILGVPDDVKSKAGICCSSSV
jgi:hypothetical protein